MQPEFRHLKEGVRPHFGVSHLELYRATISPFRGNILGLMKKLQVSMHFFEVSGGTIIAVAVHLV